MPPSDSLDEDELLPVSALAQWAYCPRRVALIHVEGLWEENRFTIEGKHFHDAVHEQGSGEQYGVRIARGVALRSSRLGLIGVADVVEFHPVEPEAADPGCALPGASGRWRPFPVEYKRGRPKRNDCDLVQLCAQALCIEEMLETSVPAGALFYGQTRRRKDVTLDKPLRQRTEDVVAEVRRLVEDGRTPPPESGPHCRKCSLYEACLPDAGKRSAARYLRTALNAIRTEPDP